MSETDVIKTVELVTACVSVHIYPDPMGGDEEEVTPPMIVITALSGAEWSIMVNGVVLSKEITTQQRFRPSRKMNDE